MKEGYDDTFRTFKISGKKGLTDVDPRSTYVYEYLFMGAPVSDIHVQWIQDDLSEKTPEPVKRINVPLYDPETHSKMSGTHDTRRWGFHID